MTSKYFFLTIVGIATFFCFLNLYGSERINIKSQTPVFDRPMGSVVYVLKKNQEFVVEKKVLIKKEKFPFMRCILFYEIYLGPDARKTAYVTPSLMVKLTDKVVKGRKQALIVKRSFVNWNLIIPGIICLAAILYFIYFHLVKKKYNLVLSTSILCLFLFFLRWIILASVQGYPISIFCCATDEWAYFNGAKDLLNFNFSSLKQVSVGTPLYYIPFCLIFGQKDIYQVLIHISKFNGFILMPTITVMLFFSARKITGSYKKSIIYILIFSLLPLFYHNYECWQELLFKSRFSIPAAGGYRLYKQYLSLGFNNLPDMPSFLILISMILYYLHGKRNYLYIIIISFLFGLACLIRLNNILLAPMVAMLFYFKFKEQYSDYKKILIHAGMAIFITLCVLGIQLVVNYLSLGGILACPYGQGEDISSTTYITTAIKAMIGSNYIFVVLGLSGIIFQPNRKYRIIFTLWGVPVILFFATTKCISLSPYRYLIAVLPGLLLAFFALPVWEKMNRMELSAAIISLVFTLIFVTPSGMSPFYGSLPFDLQLFADGKNIAVIFYCIALLIDAIALFIIRKNRNALLFLIFTFAVFFTGNSFLIITIFALVMLRSLVDIWSEVYPLFKGYYAEISGKKNIPY